MTLDEKLNEVGLKIPEILFPRKDINLQKFAVIAADQYTHDISYWDKVENFVGEDYSTYHLIYPEAYFERDKEANTNKLDEIVCNQLKKINGSMKKYINEKIYESIGPCFIFVERKARSINRRGLLVSIDLEKYDYNVGSKSLIRATELTVKDRLEVRKKIREGAVLDIPHVLVLIDDKEDLLFKKIESIKLKSFFNMDGESSNDVLYDFDLMMESGYIKGYKIQDKKDIEAITDILLELKKESKDGLLYAVGDGNHSLASAKECYKKSGKGRFALVELVNIHDDGLAFFPIHRLLKNVDKTNFINETGIDINNPCPLQELQIKIDKYLSNHKEVILDYIHGKEECIKLGEKEGNLAIVYDKFSRETLFSDVIEHGSLCRKSFSMGEAKDKRFYLEAQKIV